MAFGYARVKPDAFSDITDVRMRNDRIMQDIANQKRNWEAQQAAAEFDAWQKQNARKDYGYYDKGLAIQNGFKTQPFAGQAPSISQGLASLGITPEGKLTFGSHGSNVVKPFRSKPIFKTDENGNVSPLSEDEKALLQKQSDATAQQAAAEAASGAPVQNGGNGGSSIENNVNPQASPWYDFLKHPQNTPYEQEQMRNQGILRDAAIAAAMNKPVFFPEADTLSEPMAKLSGQQNGLAQSAMQQLTARQGMTADLFKQGMSMVNNYAMQSFNAQIEANKAFNAAKSAYKDAKILREKTEALYGKNGYEYLEAVRNKDLEKQQEIAFRYNDGMKQAEMKENDSERMLENANNFIGKANAFRGSANQISKDLEFGFNFGDEIGMYQQFANENADFVRQSDMKERNLDPIIGNGRVGDETPVSSTPNTTTPTIPAATSGASGKGNLVFNKGKVGEASVSKSDSSFEEGSPERDFENLANEYYKIGRFGVGGAWKNLDTQVQRRALDDNWLRRINGVMQKLALDLRNNPESFAKHRPLFDFIRSGNQFGDTSKLLEAAANPPESYDLSYYGNQFNATGDENERGILQEYYAILKDGGALTENEVKHLQEMLSTRFPVTNLKGEKKPLLQQNGLKLKYFKATNPDGSTMLDNGEQLYFVPLKDSFK